MGGVCSQFEQEQPGATSQLPDARGVLAPGFERRCCSPRMHLVLGNGGAGVAAVPAADVEVGGLSSQSPFDTGLRRARSSCRYVREPTVVAFPRTAVGHDVGHNPLLVPGVGTRDHGTLTHGRVRGEHGLDFAQLDAEPPKLDLLVDATSKLDRSVASPADKVAGAVQSLAATIGEGMGHEPLCRECRSVVIPACQAVSSDVELSFDSDGHGVKVGTENVRSCVIQRPADGHGVFVGIEVPYFLIGRERGAFRWAVNVEQVPRCSLAQDDSD